MKRNIITIIVLFIYLLVVMQFHSQLLFVMEETYEVYPYRFLIVLLYIPLGMLLGYLGRHENFHSKGKWKFQPLSFILLCIPSLYLSFYFLIHYLPIGRLPSFIISRQKTPTSRNEKGYSPMSRREMNVGWR